jgi:hypothetical protein
MTPQTQSSTHFLVYFIAFLNTFLNILLILMMAGTRSESAFLLSVLFYAGFMASDTSDHEIFENHLKFLRTYNGRSFCYIILGYACTRDYTAGVPAVIFVIAGLLHALIGRFTSLPYPRKALLRDKFCSCCVRRVKLDEDVERLLAEAEEGQVGAAEVEEQKQVEKVEEKLEENSEHSK